MRKITYIVLHHSATEPRLNANDNTGAELVKAICAYHKKKNALDKNYTCDYHYLVGPTGEVFSGQPEELPGWHSTNYQMNTESLGVCFLGNFEKVEMPIEQFNTGVFLIKKLMEKYKLSLKNVIRHMDVVSDLTKKTNSTQCPGKNFPYIHFLEALKYGEGFFDVGEDYPYIAEVKFLKQLGIIKGDGYGNLRPHEYITREEAMLLVYRVINALKH